MCNAEWCPYLECPSTCAGVKENEVEKIELLPCPFCGGEVGILAEVEGYQIVGCIEKSMLCPNPRLVVYKRDGEWDYKWWNQRSPVTGEGILCVKCGQKLI